MVLDSKYHRSWPHMALAPEDECCGGMRIYISAVQQCRFALQCTSQVMRWWRAVLLLLMCV